MLNARIKLRHLQAFLAVARQRSFARAAERLAITQPGISKTIRELEETLGTSLFERTPKGVALNQAGLTLLRHAGPAIRALEEGIGAIGEARDGVRRLRVGRSPPWRVACSPRHCGTGMRRRRSMPTSV